MPTAKPRTWSWHQRAAGTVRVLTYGFVASLLIAGFAARKAVADFKDGTLEAGREMAQLELYAVRKAAP